MARGPVPVPKIEGLESRLDHVTGWKRVKFDRAPPFDVPRLLIATALSFPVCSGNKIELQVRIDRRPSLPRSSPSHSDVQPGYRSITHATVAS